MKSIRGMFGAGTAMLALAGVLAAATPAMAQSADPTVVTQAELDIVEAEYGEFVDQAAVSLQTSMRGLLAHEAFSILQRKVAHKVFWGHLRVIVIADEVAKAGHRTRPERHVPHVRS